MKVFFQKSVVVSASASLLTVTSKHNIPCPFASVKNYTKNANGNVSLTVENV